MGNPHMGEVSFEANGQVYIFKFGNYAQAMLERRERRTIAQIFKAEDIGAATIQSLFYVSLFRQHKLTEEQVSDLIDEIGTERAVEIMAEAARIAQPEVAATGNQNPTQTTVGKVNGAGS